MQHCKNKKWVAAVITFNKNCKADDCDLVSDFSFEGMVKIMAARFSYLSLMNTGDNFNKIHSDFFWNGVYPRPKTHNTTNKSFNYTTLDYVIRKSK